MKTSVAKHSYIKANKRGVTRAREHINYIQLRPGPEVQDKPRLFFDSSRENISNKQVQAAVKAQKTKTGVLVHKLILSPGNSTTDITEYTRQLMTQYGRLKGLDLEWYAVEHNNTKHHHAHVVVIGKDKSGQFVRFHTDDYRLIRQLGNNFLDREKELISELEMTLERTTAAARERQPVNLIEHIRSLAARYLKQDKPKEQPYWQIEWLERHYRWREEREQLKTIEVDSVGQRPERPYVPPRSKTVISWHIPDSPDSKVTITKQSTAKEITALLRKCRETGVLLPKDDFHTVMTWLSFQRRKQKELIEKASQTTEIQIDNRTYNRQSGQDNLKNLIDEHNAGRIYLKQEQQRTINLWIINDQAKTKRKPRDKEI